MKGRRKPRSTNDRREQRSIEVSSSRTVRVSPSASAPKARAMGDGSDPTVSPVAELGSGSDASRMNAGLTSVHSPSKSRIAIPIGDALIRRCRKVFCSRRRNCSWCSLSMSVLNSETMRSASCWPVRVSLLLVSCPERSSIPCITMRRGLTTTYQRAGSSRAIAAAITVAAVGCAPESKASQASAVQAAVSRRKSTPLPGILSHRLSLIGWDWIFQVCGREPDVLCRARELWRIDCRCVAGARGV